MKNRISSIMDITKKKASFVIICVVLIATVGSGYVFATNASSQNQPNYSEENETSNKNRVVFDDMKAWWDTGWGDDEFFLTFLMERDAPISEYGIKCWNSDGKEIEYIDAPSAQNNQGHGGFCIHAINADGSHFGSLVLGETYFWVAYAVVDGERYESQINSFVFSAEGSRFGQ